VLDIWRVYGIFTENEFSIELGDDFMTHRERFVSLFNGQLVDRVPFLDYMGPCNYRSCISRWKTEGLAADADIDSVRRIIGFDYVRGFRLHAKPLFYPEFEEILVRAEENKTFSQNKWGGLEIQKIGSELMPITIEGFVKDRESWELVLDRLSGDVSARFPADFDTICEEALQSGLPIYFGDLPIGFFGGLREIIGFENLAYLFFEDPELLEEILDTLCELWITMIKYIQAEVKLNYFYIWEDMCCNTGPLISPKMSRQFLLPRYKRLTAALRMGDCSHIVLDSDGDVRKLVPLWIEGGVNIVLPWESRFGLDLYSVRKEYPTIGLIGGINKHVLECGRSEMDKELEKLPFLLESGYFIPCCDHGVTNEVSWDNYQYFYGRLREFIYRYTPSVA